MEISLNLTEDEAKRLNQMLTAMTSNDVYGYLNWDQEETAVIFQTKTLMLTIKDGYCIITKKEN